MSDKDATYQAGRKRRDQQAYRQNPNDGGYDRRTADLDGHAKLDQIISGLGVANTTATVYNLAVATADTEQSQALPANTKKFLVKSRNKGGLKIKYGSGGNYVTVPYGAVFEDDNFYSNLTVYFETTKDGDVIEIVAYT